VIHRVSLMSSRFIFIKHRRLVSTIFNSGIVITLLLVLVLSKSQPGWSPQGPFSAYTPIGPTIDGTLNYGNEWSNAYLVSLGLGDGYNGYLYIMNDAIYLYLGLEIADDDLNSGDLFIVAFDADHDQLTREDGDDDIVVDGNDGVQDNFFQGGSLSADTGAGGTMDVVGAAGASGGTNFFEIQHPFNDADDAHDLNMALSQTFGFVFQYYDQGAGILKQWPSDIPVADADITLSSAPSRPALSGRTSGTVAIDGVVGADEWATSAQSTFSISVYTVTLYTMNDATNLYVAAKISDGTLTSSDAFTVQFDNNNDGLGRGTGDDQIGVNGAGTFLDVYYFTTGSGISGLGANSDSTSGGTTDGLGAVSNSGGFSYFELMHPLNSADDAHDFSLNIGSKVGFFVTYQDEEGSATGYNRYWPSFQPSAMAEYTVADKITPTLAVVFSPGSVDIGTMPPGTGTVTATLKDGANHPISSKTVTLSYSKDSSSGPWTSFASGSTNSNGEFSAMFAPPLVGTYYFMAEVGSDANLNTGSGTSTPNSMVVIPDFSSAIALFVATALALIVIVMARKTKHFPSAPQIGHGILWSMAGGIVLGLSDPIQLHVFLR